MKKKKLGVNIDHVATIRNARGLINYPDPLRAALVSEKKRSRFYHNTLKRGQKTY